MDIFAEVEIKIPVENRLAEAENRENTDANSGADEAVLKQNGTGGEHSSPFFAQKISAAPDPIRQKFYDMRGLAPDNPYAWNDARLFYKQAKFMENFTDDYENFAEFSMRYPCFQRMGYERLRTYFSWRTRARDGEFLPVGLSYIFLYVYENLMCIGKNDPAEVLAGLSALKNAYDFPVLDEYFPSWLKDFRVYYDLPFENESAPDELLEWNKNSSYDIEKSKFFLAENALMRQCFSAAVRGLSNLCESKKIRVRDLFIHSGNEEVPWLPFRRALFFPWLKQPDRTVSLSGGEMFFCRDNSWTTLYAAPYTFRKDLTAFIIKKTEAVARQKIDFKTKITADAASVFKANAALGALGITVAEIAHAIEKSVAEFFFEKNRVVVNVNHKNLARIREEAEDITDKLVVGDEFEIVGSAASDAEEVSNKPRDATKIPVPAPENNFAHSQTPARENNFAKSLSDVETEAVKMILAGGGVEKIKKFADEKNIMLEILVDVINEKAMDTIGDNVLELSDDLFFYDEYKNLFF
ncbi:MAG: TerB N-terminal domain-containing protein [Defluviitaleaceae bacterium]|nr:TerB N-terminal domain-containing protein [Defluviitaleaceae bacterium]